MPQYRFLRRGMVWGISSDLGGGVVEKGTPTRLLVDLFVGLKNGHHMGEILERMRSHFRGSCVYIFGGLVLYCVVSHCIVSCVDFNIRTLVSQLDVASS